MDGSERYPFCSWTGCAGDEPVVVTCALLAAAAMVAWAPAPPLYRLAGLVGGESSVQGSREASPVRSRWPADRRRTHLAAFSSALLGLSIGLIVGGALGVLTGVGTAIVTGLVVRRLEPAAVVREREQLVRDLPVAVDLLAACMASGSPTTQCLEVVAQAVSGSVGRQLEQVAIRLRLGADPVSVWVSLGQCEAVAPLARTMVRAIETGAPVANGLNRLADDQRRARHWDADRRARAVGVKAAAPMGLCFLPAFIAIGIVPTVVSTFLHLHL
jgi:pilus assembly protein TadC